MIGLFVGVNSEEAYFNKYSIFFLFNNSRYFLDRMYTKKSSKRYFTNVGCS